MGILELDSDLRKPIHRFEILFSISLILATILEVYLVLTGMSLQLIFTTGAIAMVFFTGVLIEEYLVNYV